MFYVLRFLLGAAEAGFFPGIMFYLTQLVPGTRARADRGAVHDRHRDGRRDRRAAVERAAAARRHARDSTAGNGCSSSRACRRCCWRRSCSGASPSGRKMPRGCRAEERTWLSQKMAARTERTPETIRHVRRRDQQRPLVGADRAAVLLHRDCVLRRGLLAAADRAGDRHAELRHGGAAVGDSLCRGDHWDGDHRHRIPIAPASGAGMSPVPC